MRSEFGRQGARVRGRLYIPDEVKAAIREHVSSRVAEAVASFDCAAEDEDTMTGHLGAKLEIRNQRVMVEDPEISGEWQWSLRYTKFRGRGAGAMENHVGADGVFEIVATYGTRTDSKSVLFQSKFDGEVGDALLKQAIKLSTWREAAFVASYSPLGFDAYTLDSVIGARGAPKVEEARPLAEYLGLDFLDCLVGDTELRYDPRTHRLSWRDVEGEVVAVRFTAKNRLRLDVRSPLPQGIAAREIPVEDLHRHRMEMTSPELLGVSEGFTQTELKAGRNGMALTYHPDRAAGIGDLYQQILNARMQEVNAAFVELKESRRRRR